MSTLATEKTHSRDEARWPWGWLKRAFSEKSEEPRALYERGRIAERERRYEDALALYRAAAAAQPGEADFHQALASALVELKRSEEAVAALRAGLALRPDDVRMRNNLGFELLELGRLEEALPEIEQARDLAPDLAEPHYNMGIAHRHFGRIDRAIAEIGQAHELAPDNGDIHSNFLFLQNYSVRHTQADMLAAHRRYGEIHVQPVAPPALNAAWPRRLRIGYVSPDF